MKSYGQYGSAMFPNPMNTGEGSAIKRFFGGIGMEVPQRDIQVDKRVGDVRVKYTEPKICPYCRNEDVHVDSFSSDENYWVSCGQCELSGPICEGKNEAIRVWNAIEFIGGTDG